MPSKPLRFELKSIDYTYGIDEPSIELKLVSSAAEMTEISELRTLPLEGISAMRLLLLQPNILEAYHALLVKLRQNYPVEVVGEFRQEYWTTLLRAYNDKEYVRMWVERFIRYSKG